jgi:D-serine deaminase-like pyridoxal phosphate-dependent protein
VAAQRSLRLRGLQGYAGHCAHVVGWKARRDASRAAMAPLMETRALLESAGLPVQIVAGASTGTYDIDVELDGLTELQSGSYCVMDLEYRRIGGRGGDALTDFELALTVAATVVSVPTAERAIVDAGLKAFSTDNIVTDPDRRPRLGERIEFFPPHCDPTVNLYDRVWVVRGPRVIDVWQIAARGRSD